jgi:hypothetical protein
LDRGNLRTLLGAKNVSQSDVNEILKVANEGQYQVRFCSFDSYDFNSCRLLVNAYLPFNILTETMTTLMPLTIRIVILI